MEIFTSIWHWSISGFLFGIIMLCLNYLGGYFGLSSSYRTICSMAGLSNISIFFKYDWKKEIWQILFIAGIITGGYIVHLLNAETAVPDKTYIPSNLFSSNDPIALVVLFCGSLLSGFGARYAGGCTSGHLISGISNLQFPSFLVLLFFMIGGILTSTFLMQFIDVL